MPFVHVEQDLTFPMPRAAVLDTYMVYVGFDPSAAPAKPERKPAEATAETTSRRKASLTSPGRD